MGRDRSGQGEECALEPTGRLKQNTTHGRIDNGSEVLKTRSGKHERLCARDRA